MGASRGYLCDSKAFLFLYRAQSRRNAGGKPSVSGRQRSSLAPLHQNLGEGIRSPCPIANCSTPAYGAPDIDWLLTLHYIQWKSIEWITLCHHGRIFGRQFSSCWLNWCIIVCRQIDGEIPGLRSRNIFFEFLIRDLMLSVVHFADEQ